MGSNSSEACGRLRFAVADAHRISEVLASARYNFEVVRPTNPADPYQIKKQLDKLAKTCSQDDVLLIYFSGHGELIGGELLLVLDNSVPGDETTYLPVSWVRESRARCAARTRLIVLDCCHAEAAIGAKAGAVDLASIGVDSKTEAMLLASRKLELAREFAHLKGSFLTTELCRFLKDSDTETVSLTDVMRHLDSAARRHNAAITTDKPAVPVPFLNGSQQGEFFFTAATYPDLSRFVRIRDQGSEGSPVSVTLAVAIETSFAVQGQRIAVSARYLREKSRQAGEMPLGDVGEYFEPVMFIVEHFGALPESAWPWVAGKSSLPKGKSLAKLEKNSTRYKAKCFRLQGLRDVRSSLELKRPVLAPVQVHEGCGWYESKSKGVIVPPKAHRMTGGHAVLIVAADSNRFRFANTWGTTWGDKGFGWMTAEAAAVLIDEHQLWAVEAIK
jgi:hypothetical protein